LEEASFSVPSAVSAARRVPHGVADTCRSPKTTLNSSFVRFLQEPRVHPENLAGPLGIPIENGKDNSGLTDAAATAAVALLSKEAATCGGVGRKRL
jgi:hypothetical protein